MPSYVVDSENIKNSSNVKERAKYVYDILDNNGKVIDTIRLTYKEAHDEEGRYFVVEQEKYNLIQKYIYKN
jgi:hypothetical protein